MSLSVETVGRYVKTWLDFWRLRPARFAVVRHAHPSHYLSPYHVADLRLGQWGLFALAPDGVWQFPEWLEAGRVD